MAPVTLVVRDVRPHILEDFEPGCLRCQACGIVFRNRPGPCPNEVFATYPWPPSRRWRILRRQEVPWPP